MKWLEFVAESVLALWLFEPYQIFKKRYLGSYKLFFSYRV